MTVSTPLLMIAWLASVVATDGPDRLGDTGAKTPDQVRIVGIELDTDGHGGVVWTEAERLSGTDRGFVFGRGACSKHLIGDRVLAALFTAMHARTRVRVRSAKQPGGAHCLTGVRFVAP